MSMPIKSEFLELTDVQDHPVFIIKDLVTGIANSSSPQNPGTVIFLRNGQHFLVRESPQSVFQLLTSDMIMN